MTATTHLFTCAPALAGSLLLVGLTAACDPATNPDDPGTPIQVIRGRTTGALEQAPTNPRVALVWTLRPAALESCLATAETPQEIIFNCAADAAAGISASQSVAIETGFPATFEIPIYELPQPEHLNGEEGGYLGEGLLVVYDDLNNNGELDLVPLDATESVDTILSGNHRENYIIYREGELSPLWGLNSAFGCADPGQGFSVMTFSMEAEPVCGEFLCGPPCEVGNAETEVSIKLNAVTVEDREIHCPQTTAVTQFQQPPADLPYPSEADAICIGAGNQMVVNPHPERYCTMANREWYALEEPTGAWDLRETPPTWWPCEVSIVDPTDEVPVVGAYAVTSHTRNDASCDVAGPAVGEGPSHIELAVDEALTGAFGRTVVLIYACTSPTECAAEATYDWGFLMWSPDDQDWRSWTMDMSPVDATCEIVDRQTVVAPAEGDITISLLVSAGTVPLTDGATCDALPDEEIGAAMVCGSYEVMTASLLQ